jgi:hypothetical protein
MSVNRMYRPRLLARALAFGAFALLCLPKPSAMSPWSTAASRPATRSSNMATTA